eukprot:550405-Amphidinium_carterae.1
MIACWQAVGDERWLRMVVFAKAPSSNEGTAVMSHVDSKTLRMIADMQRKLAQRKKPSRLDS